MLRGTIVATRADARSVYTHERGAQAAQCPPGRTREPVRIMSPDSVGVGGNYGDRAVGVAQDALAD